MRFNEYRLSAYGLGTPYPGMPHSTHYVYRGSDLWKRPQDPHLAELWEQYQSEKARKLTYAK